jgi:serine/threonine protein kinase
LFVKQNLCSSFLPYYKGTWKSKSGNEDVAIKSVHAECEKEHKTHLALLRKEGEQMQDLHHHNVVRLFGLTFVRGHFCLILEWLNRGSLIKE